MGKTDKSKKGSLFLILVIIILIAGQSNKSITSQVSSTNIANQPIDCSWSCASRTPDNNRIIPIECTPKSEKPEKLWSLKVDGAIWSTPAVADGYIYFTTANGYLYCADCYSGTIIWKFSMEFEQPYQISSSPVVYKGMVFACSWKRGLACLNAVTGSLLWQDTRFFSNSTPIIANDKLVVVDARYSKSLVCIEPNTGLVVSQTEINEGYLSSTGKEPSITPLVVNDKVYFSNCVSDIYCCDLGTFLVWWHKDINDNHWTAPAYSNGKLVVSGLWNASCMDSTNGALLWQYEMAGDRVLTSPIIENGRVYLGSYERKQSMVCLDLDTGKEIWTNEDIYGIMSSFVICGNYIYALSYSLGLMCIDKGTGKILWSKDEYKKAKESSIVFAYNRIYIGTEEGKLFCLGDPPCSSNPCDKSMTFWIGSTKWKICDQEQPPLATAPEIKKDRTFMVISNIATTIGATVAWDKDTKRITITREKDNKRIVFWIGSNMAIVGHAEVMIDEQKPDVAPYISHGKTMLPLNFICNVFGMLAKWDNDTKETTLTYRDTGCL